MLHKYLPGYGKKIGEEGFDLGTDNWNKVEDSKYQKPKKSPIR